MTISHDQAAVYAASTLLRAALDAMPDLAIVVLDTEMRITAVHGGGIHQQGFVRPAEPQDHDELELDLPAPEQPARPRFARAKLVGRHAPDVLPAEVWEIVGPLYAQALAGASTTIDLHALDGGALLETTFEPITTGSSIVGVIATSRDVTRQRRAEELVDHTFEHAPIGMCIVAPDGRFLRANDALCTLLGRDRATLLAGGFQELTHPDDLSADLHLLEETLAGDRDGYEMEKRYVRPDGSIVDARLSVHLVRDERGEPEHFISQIVDLTERKTAERHLRYLADHDVLTGLVNRRRFEHELQRACATLRTDHARAGLLLIDLDGFKAVNDSLGHSAGDDVLTRVAAAMKASLRPTDIVGRLGGDEFAVLIPGVEGDAGTRKVADKLVEIIREHGTVTRDGRTASVTASIGITVLDPDGPRTPEEALGEADAALYEAKAAGRDRAH